MALLKIEIQGQEKVIASLQELEDKLDVESILDDAAALLLNRIRTRFLAETDTEGQPWVPSFAARLRALKGRGGGTLFNTGTLFESIQLWSSSPGERVIATDVPYGGYHQFGTRLLPKREFLGVAKDDADTVQQLVLKRISDYLGK